MVASAIAQTRAATARYAATSTTVLASATTARWPAEPTPDAPRSRSALGSTAATTASATAQITAPETIAAMRRSRERCALVARAGSRSSASWRNASRHMV